MQAAHQVAQQAGWTVLRKSTTSQFRRGIDIDERGKIARSIGDSGCPKQTWGQVRANFMKVLLDEHQNILKKLPGAETWGWGWLGGNFRPKNRLWLGTQGRAIDRHRKGTRNGVKQALAYGDE